ncbi:hypothetical protein B484DRAFT_403387 [Ochromonadaceae sp. CCMP2298]|nr:hypothetical protein B484DRAFT_403387 [Ochromonadaceae sp. CCMP2298]
MPKTTFLNTYTRWEQKGYTHAIGHNPEMLDDQAKIDLLKECKKRTLEQQGWRTTAQFQNTLERFWRDTLHRRGDKRWRELPFEPSESAVREKMGEFIPHKRRQGDKQDAARLRARTWLLVLIASAAVSKTSLTGENGGLWPADPTAVRSSLIYITDELSTDLNPSFTKAPVRVAAGFDAELREGNLGIKNATGLDASVEAAAYSTPENQARSALTGSSTFSSAEAKEAQPKKVKPISAGTSRGTRWYGDMCAHRGVSIDFTTAGDGTLVCMTATFKDKSLCDKRAERHRQRVMKGAHVDMEELTRNLASMLHTSGASAEAPGEPVDPTQASPGLSPIASSEGASPLSPPDDPGDYVAETAIKEEGKDIRPSKATMEKNILKEGNEAALLTYMKVVHAILVKHNFKAPLYRTIFKFLANFERWAHSSMTPAVILGAYETTSWVPWSLDSWLRRWSGYKKLTLSDLEFIGEAFPNLVSIAEVNGVIHQEDASDLLANFIEGAQKAILSKVALANLAATAMRKPTHLRPFNQWGACHMSSSGILELRREASELREAESLLREQEAGQKNVTTEMRESIYDLFKCLEEKDYLKLRLVCRAFWTIFVPNRRFALKLAGILQVRRSAATRNLNMQHAQEYLEEQNRTATTPTTPTTNATTTTTTNPTPTPTPTATTTATTTTTTATATAPPTNKRKYTTRCAFVGCTSKLDKTLAKDQWTACGKGKCKLLFCEGIEPCTNALRDHRGVCGT